MALCRCCTGVDRYACPKSDLPNKAAMARTRRLAEADGITRREAAQLLGLHPDSITRLLPEGLGAAVVAWGGHGREMTFSRLLVTRWQAARICLATGRGCNACDLAMFCMVADAEHQTAKRHGVGGCADCWVPWPPGAACCAEEGRA